MDYTKFLAKKETMVLPYFGGTRVSSRDRRLRVKGEAEPGWWEFEVEGRNARPVRKTEPADLSDLPATRGHFAGGWLFFSGRELGRLALPPDVEPEPLAPCIGRRWYSGDWLFDSVDFEDEAEDAARRALELGESIATIKGVSPGLRAAYGYSLIEAAGRAVSVPVSPQQAIAYVHDVANGGRAGADTVIARIRFEREEWARLLAAERHERELVGIARRAQVRNVRRSTDPADVCDRALRAAGARMLRCRQIAEETVEVTFQFMGERFISVVNSATLQVYDAGICLSGTDRELTLESLPSAIKEAIETSQLNITAY